MGKIEFVHLSDVREDEIIDLMNNPRVARQMPLLAKGFSAEDCQVFLTGKKRLWDEHGFGPSAFLINGEFAGWGGLQPEQGEVDFALVLHPKFWGWGRAIFIKVRDRAFGQMNLNSITILFPPSRPNWRAITRLGFAVDGQVEVGGERFMRFRVSQSQQRQALKSLRALRDVS